ncbi:MAG: hypothetical protein JWM27_715 [Gemmatimonadetes bacterium]|nr:hypothetical protein [Gemmatimonadota bacterium]
MIHPLRLLLRTDLRRATDAVRHPRAGAWLAALLPSALAIGGLWRMGAAARPDATDGQGRILLALLASAAPCLLAYPTLFRAPDDSLLRHLGIRPRWIFAVRALRLALWSSGAVLLLMVPYAATGARLAPPLAMGLAAASVACAVSLFTHAGAAVKMASGARAVPGLIGWDPELAAAAPLVFAPLWPAVAAVVSARWVGAAPDAWGWRLPAALALAAVLVAIAAARFEAALPRFASRAAEMAYAPESDGSADALVIGRGLARVLPRRAGAVRARDAAVVGRRFRWASRMVWPVAVVSVLALLRAGDSAHVRAWVTASAAVLLAAQTLAVVALGRVERGGPRWMDRALGITVGHRLLGRGAAAFGLGMGVVLPIGIAWALAVPGGSAWPWLAAGAGAAALASAASLAAAGR